ncbi:exopolysaccharide biosynthesis protein [Roseivirga sp.]|uniref:exopolysaccharide biosynthesis protein n=1 Tax=Roseivirga sp. TaxID=1964215 RepID=UPI003B515EF0
MNKDSKNFQEDGVFQFLKQVLTKGRSILLYGGIFFLIGIGIALSTGDEYTASSVFIPQVSNGTTGGNGSGLGSLASLAGINLGTASGNDEFPPSLYPNILNNVYFKLSILEAPLFLKRFNKKVSYREYFEEYYQPPLLYSIKKYTVGLPSLILSLFEPEEEEQSKTTLNQNGESMVKLTEQELRHFSRIDGQISIVSNLKDGFVTISVSMPEPELAAQLAKYVEDLLERELINYKVKNAQHSLDFIIESYNDKKLQFIEKQEQLAVFIDGNRNINTESAKIQLQQLQAEYNVAYEVYLSLAKELEQAKLQINRDTPTMAIIQPVLIPSSKSGLSRKLIVIMFTFVGLVVIPVRIYLKNYLVPFVKNLS